MQAHGILAETSIASAGLLTQYIKSQNTVKAAISSLTSHAGTGEEFVDLAVDTDVTFADRFLR